LAKLKIAGLYPEGCKPDAAAGCSRDRRKDRRSDCTANAVSLAQPQSLPTAATAMGETQVRELACDILPNS
jgi:hypothetical protein